MNLKSGYLKNGETTVDNIKMNFCFAVSVAEPLVCFNYGYGKCYRGREARALVPILPCVFLLCHTFLHSLPFCPEDRSTRFF